MPNIKKKDPKTRSKRVTILSLTVILYLNLTIESVSFGQPPEEAAFSDCDFFLLRKFLFFRGAIKLV